MLAKRAIRANPEMSEAWDTLAELYYLDGQTEDALRAIDRAISIGGENSERLILRREKILRVD